jgi:hypothetical protein
MRTSHIADAYLCQPCNPLSLWGRIAMRFLACALAGGAAARVTSVARAAFDDPRKPLKSERPRAST